MEGHVVPERPGPVDVPSAAPLWRAVVLHLLPGWLTGALYVPLGAALDRRDLPPVWALMALCATVLLPLEVALLRRAGIPLVLRVRPLDARAWRVTAATVAAAALLPGLALVVPVPAVPGVPDPAANLSHVSGPARTATVLAWLLLFGVVGPVIEETYFRGWLLGRLAPLGRLAVVVHAGLFAAYHAWQPGAWLRVLLFTVPLAWAYRRTRRRLPGLVAHVLVNVVAWTALLRGP